MHRFDAESLFGLRERLRINVDASHGVAFRVRSGERAVATADIKYTLVCADFAPQKSATRIAQYGIAHAAAAFMVVTVHVLRCHAHRLSALLPLFLFESARTVDARPKIDVFVCTHEE